MKDKKTIDDIIAEGGAICQLCGQRMLHPFFAINCIFLWDSNIEVVLKCCSAIEKGNVKQ